MNTYAITIKATVYKTIRVEADNQDEACVDAFEQFSVLPEAGVYERYEEQVVDIEEVAA